MARAETLTKLSLDRWAAIIGISPLSFNGVYFGRTPTVCEQPWMQFAFQAADRVGREGVAFAIAQAEEDIETALGYRLLPTWEEDEWRRTARGPKPELIRELPVGIRGFAQTVRAEWGYMISGGIRQKEIIEAGRPITYSSLDGDTYKEQAAATVVLPSGVPPAETRIYYPGHSGDDDYEIRPVTVDDTVSPATITLRREQLVKPTLQIDLVPPDDDSHWRGVDGAVDANFETEVDVYRVYNDPQTQATFLWEPFGSGSCAGCVGAGCAQCAYTAQTGCLMLRDDPRLSVVSYRPATWDATSLEFDSAVWASGRQPDLVRLFYYAGWRKKNLAAPTIQMDRFWERVVAYYAAALLDRPVCECNNVHAWVENWQRDLRLSDQGRQINISRADLENPFGTRRGAIYAWHQVQRANPIGTAAMVG